MQFRTFDIDAFLRDHWQKAPLLIRNPWTAWRNPLEPDELAGLACEAGVESRLVISAKGKWKVEHGPMPESRFSKLGKAGWTLLVQAVDHHAPDVAALIAPFRFIPDWRIDDVMVSYAADGGGVGPHFDQYDVFLVQGAGRRRWRIGAPVGEDAALLPHDDLRLLAAFEATEEWVLEPGDILYVPPGVPHDGVAVGDDCMTYSIGFRAPSRSELIAHWSDHLLEGLQDDDRYRDPAQRQDNPGEIAPAALAGLQAMILERMRDPAAFARWFGEYVTAPKYAEADWRPEEEVGAAEVRERIAEGLTLSRNPASRFSFVRQDRDALLLFVDGACFECTGAVAAFAERLCARAEGVVGSDDACDLIAALVNQGSVAFGEEV